MSSISCRIDWIRKLACVARLLLRALPVVVCGLLGSAAAHAQEFYLLAGAQQTPELDEGSYAFGLEYLHNLTDRAYATFYWRNEGHVTDHHRDGFSTQIWFRNLNATRTFDVSIGIGPFRYYDTTTHEASSNTINDHGFGMLYSVAAHWYPRAPWIVQLRYDRAQVPSSIDTNNLLVGIGYQFDRAQRAGPIVPAPSYGFTWAERNELTVLLGSTIVNDFQSPQGAAGAIEYRRNLTPYIDASVSLIDEGDADVFRRHGITAQLWVGRRFGHGRADIGIGLGPYVARDEDEEGSTTRMLALLTMTASYQLSAHWSGRLSWCRAVTTNSRDTDIIVAGVGRHF